MKRNVSKIASIASATTPTCSHDHTRKSPISRFKRVFTHWFTHSNTSKISYSPFSASASLPNIALSVEVNSAKEKEEALKLKWKNYRTRGFWGLIMIFLFTLLILAGPLCMLVLVVAVQTMIFKEIVGISSQRYRERRLKWCRTINWYFLLSSLYWLVGENLIIHFGYSPRLSFLGQHHRFISFCLYVFGVVGFVLNLKKGHYRFQFDQFGLTHMVLILIVLQGQALIHNLFSGIFWFVFPISLVIFNDVFAYFFGFFLGKTPLIKLSPKKTWEGFIGAFISTVIFGFFFSGFLCRFGYLISPVNSIWKSFLFSAATLKDSKPSSLFIKGEQWFFGLVIYPVQKHALIWSVFASLIAPFGGFFASGFKRAFKLKDFDDLIPGHGGLTDRMDCQFLMGSFVYFYYSTFLYSIDIDSEAVIKMIMMLKDSERRKVMERMEKLL